MATNPLVLPAVQDGIGWMVLDEPARLNPVYPERIAEINVAAAELSARDKGWQACLAKVPAKYSPSS